MNEVRLASDINAVYCNVKDILDSARSRAYRAVNAAMVEAYWQVGRIIVEEEQKGKERAEYGKGLIKILSKKLTNDYGKGFNITNLKFMKAFYLKFPKGYAARSLLGKSQALRDQLTWTHYRSLLRIQDDQALSFYIQECIDNRWSTRELDRQINSMLYERSRLGNSEKTKLDANKNKIELKPVDIIKDPYVLEFLDLKSDFSFQEKDLEQAIISKLQQFILELGKGFAFVARQKRINVGDEHYFIDLLFYNYILKCYVLIDIKTGKLSPKDAGQMDFYVRYFQQEEMLEGDNPPIGLILCADKDEAMVQYTLINDENQVFASQYRTYLPSEEDLKNEILRSKEAFELKKSADQN